MIYESSWEVCNKMGGIYTVLTTRARRMMAVHSGKICFIGPWLSQDLPQDFDPTPPQWLKDWHDHCASNLDTPLQIGRWRVIGAPPVILVDFRKLYDEKAVLFFELWEQFGLSSDNRGGEYDRSILFGIAASRVMMSLHSCVGSKNDVAIFNEWMLGGGLLYTKRHCPDIQQLFITHATSVGRSIAGNGRELYGHIDGYNGDQMAHELNVVEKHIIEKKAALEADIFATVSDVTAREAEQLIGRKPIVLPNGFESDFVPKGKDYETKRTEARKSLIRVVEALIGRSVSPNSLLVSLGGRYEYRNKGIDIYLETLAHLQHKYKTTDEPQPDRPLVAFLLVPAWVYRHREDLKYRLEEKTNFADAAIPLQYPTLTHWLHDTEQDVVMRRSRELGLTNDATSSVLFVFVPCYLDAQDGIFNRSYYDLLIGMDVNVYPSYYEPWGYTPMESIAFGIPAITTDLAGFGMWAMQRPNYQEGDGPVYVLPRRGHKDDEMILALSEILDKMLKASTRQETRTKAQACTQIMTEEMSWEHFYDFYLHAFDSR